MNPQASFAAAATQKGDGARNIRVLFATAEAQPLAKSGGLADVCSALPGALRRAGADARIVLPGYDSAVQRLDNPYVAARISPALGEPNAFLLAGDLPGSDVPVWLVCAPALFGGGGGLYRDTDGRDRADNARRFGYFARIAAELAMGRLGDWQADILHAHDWHAGLTPYFLSREAARPATLFTVHNLAFQGNFPPHQLAEAGLPGHAFSPDGVEFYGQFSFLKAGLRFSDKLTTVSTHYRDEILTDAFGCGLHGLLQARQRDLVGILNGIDVERWNPATDKVLAGRFSAQDISGKRLCKADFQRALGLAGEPSRPLIGFVSRLSHQKMADVLLGAAPQILAAGAQLAVVGDGDAKTEEALGRLAENFPGALAARRYDEDTAHRLQAGCDILLAPARYEPCGLTQLYALRYGTVPIVRRTGGLAESVVDAADEAMLKGQATGFVFDDPTEESLMTGVGRALALYREPLAWRRLQLAGMAQDFGWERSAARYLSLYQALSGLRLPAALSDGPLAARSAA